ncbi:MAG: ATP-binding protein [Metallosphaera sp.]|uniref:AAA ATPase n=1 Tax=Metallosphaera cuprina (strain Ar-4) TaxID=1006006 RepID=F4FYW0_METCR|nr:AAA ATPase [Metallosphaera cuprina Ar-4]
MINHHLVGYKYSSLSDFLFEKGDLISIFGSYATGKTAIALQVLKEMSDGVFISTTGEGYKSRVRGKYSSSFVDVANTFQLFNAVIEAIENSSNLIIVDSINRFFKLERKYRQLLMTLNMLKLSRSKVLLTWEMSTNNKVSGHAVMRYYSDEIFRTTGKYIIGNGKKCEFKILTYEVKGCY